MRVNAFDACSRRLSFRLGVVLAVSFSFGPPRAGAASPSRVHVLSSPALRADDYFLGRERLANVEQGLQLLRQAVAENPSDYQAWWRVSKFENYLGRHTDGVKTEIRCYQAGVEAGRRAVALEPNRVEGHFWLGANYGLMAEDEGLIRGLRWVDAVRNEMETVIRLDPDYEQGAGQRSLARVYYRAPFFKGGDKHRSIELLQDCLKRYPDDSLTLLYLADDYLAVGRREEARGLFEKILQLCPDPLYGPELADNQSEARDRLQHAFRSGK